MEIEGCPSRKLKAGDAGEFEIAALSSNSVARDLVSFFFLVSNVRTLVSANAEVES